jgi:hypothetical protein
MAYGMQDYEEQIAGFKTGLFADLFTCQIHSMLEVGMGTGPNLKYLAAQKVSIWPTEHMITVSIFAALQVASNGMITAAWYVRIQQPHRKMVHELLVGLTL